MVNVAAEMQRLNFQLPLLIGGATTSKAHTAVKIEPRYKNNITCYVADASRAVGVMQKLVDPQNRAQFWEETQAEYAVIRDRVANRKKAPLLTYEQACANAFKGDWGNYCPPKPNKLGIQVFKNHPVEEIIPFIDWTPFFISWELAGKFPAILQDEIVGEAARNLFADAQSMLKRIVAEKLFTANAVVGIWPAQRRGADDVVIYNEDKSEIIAVQHHLRQQMEKQNTEPNYSLADFIAPEGTVDDYVGGFVVTSGFEPETLSMSYKEAMDDYNAIMIKALGDRLAEGFAEYMHHKIRTEIWGYVPQETLDNEALIDEQYQGIRPAPGYPACPDHTEKETLFKLLNATENTGVYLSDNFAMMPPSSVSGWYFSHPQSKYFNVKKINHDQVEDIAKRKGKALNEMEHWLIPVLNYDYD
jgi:5-methyltetrahydrofolate--homocysteine methyltransferase